MEKKIVVIDAGHGGHDSGAVGQFLKEKDVNLDVALRVKNLLSEDERYQPYLTRVSDKFVPLTERAIVTNTLKADVFVSIHCNAFINEKPHDLQVYYYKGSKKGKRLAKILFDKMTLLDGEVSAWSKVIENHSYYVLRKTICPSALIELEFISNPKGEELLASTDFLEKASLEIKHGLDEYFFGEEMA